MTFHSLNESHENRPNVSGHFGVGVGRNIRESRQNAEKPIWTFRKIQIPKLGNISGERLVDIICISLISVFLLSVFINWNAFLDALYFSVLFPIVFVGAKLLGIIAGLGAVGGYIYARFHRPRRW